MAVVIVLGWFWFSPHLYASAWNPHHMSFLSGLGASIPITLWAFLGLESASANMDRVENPKKNVPIAVLGGTIGAGVLYILGTNVVQGIVPNLDLAKSNAPFGLVFAHMFNPTIGNIVMALMVISCFGSLLGWQFTIAEVFRSSAQEGYFPKVFNKVIGNGTPLVGIVIITIIQSLLAFSSISPSLSAQFTILVDLAVVTNCVPYLLSVASLKNMQKLDGGVSSGKQRINNLVAVVAGLYTLYAISQAGNTAIVLGSMVTFFGWTLYGFESHRFDKENGKVAEEVVK